MPMTKCACGCGRPLPPPSRFAPGRRKYADRRCGNRHYQHTIRRAHRAAWARWRRLERTLTEWRVPAHIRPLVRDLLHAAPPLPMGYHTDEGV